MQASQELPRSQEAEECVIGGILFGGAKALARVRGMLEPEHFYFAQLQAIYAAMVEADQQGHPIDIVTVADHMRRAETLAKLTAYGGESFLLDLSTRVATVENIAHHAQMVRDKAVTRRLMGAAQRVIDQGYRDDPPADLLSVAMSSFLEAAAPLGQGRLRPLRTLLHGSLTAFQQRYERKSALTGIGTGFARFDEITGGLQPGRLYVLGARPKMGKSALGFQVAMQAHDEQNHAVPALGLSLEMVAQIIADRAIVQASRMDTQRYAAGQAEQRDWIALTRAVDQLSRRPVWLADQKGLTLGQVRAAVTQWRASLPGQPPLALVVLDYLQLVKAQVGDKRRQQNREQEIAEVAQGLVSIATDQQVAMLALAQVNREVEKRSDKRPGAGDLRESGAIEAAADMILTLYRDEVYHKDSTDAGTAELIVCANRHGPTDMVRLKWNGESVRFDNLSVRPY